METIHRKPSRKAQFPMARWCQEWLEENEAFEVDWTSPGSP